MGSGPLEDTEKLRPVAEPAAVPTGVKRPCHRRLRFGQAGVASAVHGDLLGWQDKTEVGSRSIGRAGRQQRVEPKLIIRGLIGGVSDARLKRERSLA